MARGAKRDISWLKGALKDFRAFPLPAQQKAARGLTQIAEGDTPEIAKPMTGLGAGVWELAIKQSGDAFRVIYALRLDDDVWVVHAFQKKSISGVATPKHEIDVVLERIKRLKEALS